MGEDAVAQHFNHVLRPVGLGAYHGAIEVYGREWSFGWSDDGTGVFSCSPRCCPQHSYRESIDLGTTELNRRDVAQLLRQLEWPGDEYDLIRRNCCHWCEEFARRLGADALPPWLNGLADEMARIDDGVRDVANHAVELARQRGLEAHERATELRESVEAAVKAKNDEILEQVETAWREWQLRAEALDEKLGLTSSLRAAGEDLKSLQSNIDAWRQRFLPLGGAGDEKPLLPGQLEDISPALAHGSEKVRLSVGASSLQESERFKPGVY